MPCSAPWGQWSFVPRLVVLQWLPFVAANLTGKTLWAALYGFGAHALGHEAKTMAGPPAIVIGVIAVAALAAAGLYIRRYEQRLRQAAIEAPVPKHPQVILK